MKNAGRVGPASIPALQDRAEDAVGRTVTVGEGLDVDDDLLAHREPPFDRRRAHMWQQDDIIEGAQPRVDRRLVLEYIETGAGNRAGLEHAKQFLLVDDLAARRIDEDRLRPQQA